MQCGAAWWLRGFANGASACSGGRVGGSAGAASARSGGPGDGVGGSGDGASACSGGPGGGVRGWIRRRGERMQ